MHGRTSKSTHNVHKCPHIRGFHVDALEVEGLTMLFAEGSDASLPDIPRITAYHQHVMSTYTMDERSNDSTHHHFTEQPQATDRPPEPHLVGQVARGHPYGHAVRELGWLWDPSRFLSLWTMRERPYAMGCEDSPAPRSTKFSSTSKSGWAISEQVRNSCGRSEYDGGGDEVRRS